MSGTAFAIGDTVLYSTDAVALAIGNQLAGH